MAINSGGEREEGSRRNPAAEYGKNRILPLKKSAND